MLGPSNTNPYSSSLEGTPHPMAAAFVAVVVVLALSAFRVAGDAAGGSSLNITNACSCSIWPAVSTSGAESEAALQGFELPPSQWRLVALPFGWTGRVWARTLCSTDSISGKFSCVTGDCGTGSDDCAAAPVTLAEFRMNGIVDGRDSYDVTVVHGFNIPMLVAPQRVPGGNECAPTGCIADLNAACPPELRVTTDAGGAHVVACMSACQAFESPEFCCTGDHGQPRTCTPSVYSEIVKQLCPLVITYPYDVVNSIYSCGSGGGSAVSAITYTITFCPNIIANSVYTSQQPTTTTTPSTGGSQLDAARIALITAVLGLITAAIGVLAQFLGLFKKCSGWCCR